MHLCCFHPCDIKTSTRFEVSREFQLPVSLVANCVAGSLVCFLGMLRVVLLMMCSPRNAGCIIPPLFLTHMTVETSIFYYGPNEYSEVFCDLQHTTVCEVASELDIYSPVVHDCRGQDSMIQVIVSNPMFSSIQKHKISGR